MQTQEQVYKPQNISILSNNSEKKPRKICGPGPCPLVQGKESRCRKVVETIVHDVPEEKCDLVPKKDCKFVTKQIPL